MNKTKIEFSELHKLAEDIDYIYKIVKDEVKKTSNNIITYNNKIYCLNKSHDDHTFESTIKKNLNIDNLITRNKLKKNKGLYLKLKNLDKILSLLNKFNFYQDNYKFNLITNSYIDFRFTYSSTSYHLVIRSPFDNFSYNSSRVDYYIDNIDKYQELVNFIETINKENGLNKNINTINLFDSNNNIFIKYKNTTLEEYDLSVINFDDKNISGINISKNKEVYINFDKIIKDLTDSNISGYDLNKYTFRNYNLTNTDLRNTGATVDLATCTISEEGKMNQGTLFDENNKFIFNSKKLSLEQVEDLGIKIYKKER